MQASPARVLHSEPDDGLSLPEFLKVENRVPLTVEQQARVDAIVAPKEGAATADLKTQQTERKKEKARVRIEKLKAKKSGATTVMPLTGKAALKAISAQVNEGIKSGAYKVTKVGTGKEVVKLDVDQQGQIWAGRIATSWQKCVEGIVETGKLLIEAKADLGHGRFEDMVLLKLPFDPRTARMLMSIAENPAIANRNHGSVLPPSWRTLYELARLSPAVIEEKIKSGKINPKMERKDAVALLPPPNKKSDETADPSYPINAVADEATIAVEAGDVGTATAMLVDSSDKPKKKRKLSPAWIDHLGGLVSDRIDAILNTWGMHPDVCAAAAKYARLEDIRALEAVLRELKQAVQAQTVEAVQKATANDDDCCGAVT
jgi:hypothetical protein